MVIFSIFTLQQRWRNVLNALWWWVSKNSLLFIYGPVLEVVCALREINLSSRLFSSTSSPSLESWSICCRHSCLAIIIDSVIILIASSSSLCLSAIRLEYVLHRKFVVEFGRALRNIIHISTWWRTNEQRIDRKRVGFHNKQTTNLIFRKEELTRKQEVKKKKKSCSYQDVFSATCRTLRPVSTRRTLRAQPPLLRRWLRPGSF